MRIRHALVLWLALAAPAMAADRIAVVADGNYNDRDDWGATPATLAILSHFGLTDALVHYSYNGDLGANNPALAQQMASSTLGAAEQFGFSRGVLFDAQTQLVPAIENLRQLINASTPLHRLYVLEAGPVELLWRALDAADPIRRPFVTVISHSRWNNNRGTHTAESVKAFGVSFVQISDQNIGFNTHGDWAPWNWLSGSYVYQRMIASGKPDISDAGMAYYLVTGYQNGTPAKLRVLLESQ